MKNNMISIIIVATVVLLGREFVANNLLTEGNFLRFQTSEFSLGYTSGVCTHSEIKLVYKAIGGQTGSSQHNVYEKCKALNCNYEKFLCTEDHTLGTIIYYSSDEAKVKFGSNYSEGSHYYTKCSKGCGQGFAQEHNWESILIPENEVVGYGWPTDVYHYYWNTCAQCKEQKKNATGSRIAIPVKHVFEMGKCRLCPKIQPGYTGTGEFNLTMLEDVFNGKGSVTFTYKGTKFTIDQKTLKIIMNMMQGEIGANKIEQVIAQFQILLNTRSNDLYDIINSSLYDEKYAEGTNEWNYYVNQVKNAIMQVMNNSGLSQEVSSVLGDTTATAGTGDIENGSYLVDAMKTYPGVVVAEGTLLEGTGEWKHDVYITEFPYRYCQHCMSENYITRYLGLKVDPTDGKEKDYCFNCKRYTEIPRE